jgi:hypothetical protein
MDGLLEYIGLAQQKSEKEVAKGPHGSIWEKAKSLKGMLLFFLVPRGTHQIFSV